MNNVGGAFLQAWQLIVACDAHLLQIVELSLSVSITAVAVATLLALPAMAEWRQAALAEPWEIAY